MQNGFASEFVDKSSWVIMSSLEQSIKRKIAAKGTPLKEWDVHINRGVITGYNEAFIISADTKNNLVAEDPRSAEIIRPILRGRDIRRYGFTFANLYVIVAQFGSYEYMEAEYPAIYRHLCQYKEALQKRGQCRYTSSGKRNTDRPYPGQHHWLELDNNPRQEYLDDFSKQKIAYAETMRVHRNAGADRFPRFSYVEEGYFHDKTCFIMTGNDLRYIHAVMNSSLMNYYIHKNIAVLDTGGFLMQKIYVELFPIPQADESTKEYLSQLQQRVIELRQQGRDSSCEENEIDECVYLLFGLSDEEIAYVGDSI